MISFEHSIRCPNLVFCKGILFLLKTTIVIFWAGTLNDFAKSMNKCSLTS